MATNIIPTADTTAGRAVNAASVRLRRHPCFRCGIGGELIPSTVRELAERVIARQPNAPPPAGDGLAIRTREAAQ
jgi:hypothetical protein